MNQHTAYAPNSRLVLRRKLLRELPLHLYLLPAVVLVIIFCYVPMVGVVVAFQNFKVFKGWFAAPWVGLDNFRYVVSLPNFGTVMFNTVYISVMKIIASLAVPIVVSLMFNEMQRVGMKRVLQTVMYLPYFMSWIILGGIVKDMLDTNGLINTLLGSIGIKGGNLITDKQAFPGVLVVTDIWKNFGYNTIIYMAAITSIDPSLYEAAMIDGANRWRQAWHVTLPGMRTIIVMLATLSLGSILSAGFEQVLVLYNSLVMDTGDIIDTFVYRLGLEQGKYAVSTAVGLFKSAVSTVLIALAYYLAGKFANYRIF